MIAFRSVAGRSVASKSALRRIHGGRGNPGKRQRLFAFSTVEHSPKSCRNSTLARAYRPHERDSTSLKERPTMPARESRSTQESTNCHES
jgi:hypothetical protein